MFEKLTVYPAYSSVGRGNLVLRHAVPHFSLNILMHGVLIGGTQRRDFVLMPERRNFIINE